MKRSTIAIGLCLLTVSAWGEQKAVLLSAYATSRSADSTDPICLVGPACQGHWSPGAKDNGVDEGLYYQFEAPIQVSYIEIHFKDKPQPIRFYIDGKTTSPAKQVYLSTSLDDHTLRIGIRKEDEVAPMTTPLRSFFFCLDNRYDQNGPRVEIDRVIFLSGTDPAEPRLVIQLPNIVPAVVTATSVLDPVSAYQPAHLFDSRIDLAWATDGSKTKGVNESFTVEFKNPQTLSGVILWNGYQRSTTHYQANSRIQSAEISSDGDAAESIDLKDTEGPQHISFQHTRTTRTFTFKIKAVYPGAKYADVLLSELRFVQPSGQLLLPRIDVQETPVPAAWLPVMDRSWTSILSGFLSGECGEMLFDNRFRIRSDGTFIIYIGKGFSTEDNRMSAQVLEGNWEPKGDQIRIFGKKYSTDIVTSEYLNEAHSSAPAIFQSLMVLKRYTALTIQERHDLLAATPSDGGVWYMDVSKDDSKNYMRASGVADFVAKADAQLSASNPYVVQSPAFTAVLSATDDVGTSGGGCE